MPNNRLIRELETDDAQPDKNAVVAGCAPTWPHSATGPLQRSRRVRIRPGGDLCEELDPRRFRGRATRPRLLSFGADRPFVGSDRTRPPGRAAWLPQYLSPPRRAALCLRPRPALLD